MAIDYHYSYTEDELYRDWLRLVTTPTTHYKSGAQFKPGLKLCHHFFPNFWHIENDRGNSFAKCWQDYELMDRVRQWGLQSMSSLWLSWIRRAVYMQAGLSSSTFYRPHFAKLIINQPTGHLFDPCAGWGGRMLGTVAAGWTYEACEPNQETYSNLMRLIDFLSIHDQVRIHNRPVESITIPTSDIVLTSPPYFNLERYNNDNDQCYNKWTNYNDWEKNWFIPLMEECITKTKMSAWNVMNHKGNDMVQSVMKTHERMGMKLTKTVGFDSPFNNLRKVKNKDMTYVFG